MATRNLTSKFESLRQASKRKAAARAASLDPSLTDSDLHGNGNDGNRKLLDPSVSLSSSGGGGSGTGLVTDDHNAIRVGLEHALPPEWVEIVETMQRDIKAVKDHLVQLEKLHAMRLKVTFGSDEVDQERDIDVLTQEITRVLKRCETSLKSIATIGNARGTNLPQQERVVRLNVMRNLGAELHALSLQFRKAQKDFLLRLKGQEEVGNDFFKDDNESKQPLSLEEALERGLTPSQQAQLQDQMRHADDRQKEIIHIAQSINELAAIFRELSVLVIEQGTILDRIDYNIEQTLVKVEAGTKELEQANEYSKKARTIKCMLALLLMVILLIVILIIRHTQFKS